MRGDRKRRKELGKKDSSEQGADDKVIEIKGYQPRRIPHLLWRACIKKVWEPPVGLRQEVRRSNGRHR